MDDVSEILLVVADKALCFLKKTFRGGGAGCGTRLDDDAEE